MDTIYALATAAGKSGVAVVRISGPSAKPAVKALAGDVPPSRVASLRRLTDADGILLDVGLVLIFDAGHSFTGEDVAELQIHGSTATAKAIQSALGALPDLRLAEPGEFTRRALENNQLDLAQVEGLADLIEAETEAQRRQALQTLSGALSDKAEAWRTDLIRAAALLEATIDFADEDVPVDVSPEVSGLIEQVQTDLATEQKGVPAAERIRDGFEVAIIGAPNTGKSTLLNALAGRDAAITSEVAGTTRDVIEVRMDIGGLPVTLLDTAGLRDTEDQVEKVGVSRARERAEAADLRVVLMAPGDPLPDIFLGPDDVTLRSKSDISKGADISGLTGDGVPNLVAKLSVVLADRAGSARSATHARHLAAIERSSKALESAIHEVKQGPDRAEIAAEEIRSATRALNSLVGRVDVEDILDEVFASFCLGK
jgi:tRNA modification GTPase